MGRYYAGAAAAGGPDVYYWGFGSDTYGAVASFFLNANSGGDKITATLGGTITKIGMKVQETTGAGGRSFRVSIWNSAGTTMYDAGTVNLNANDDGWFDYTLASPIAGVANGTTFIVIGAVDTSGDTGVYGAASTDGVLSSGRGYANELTGGTLTFSETGETPYAVRLYVD